jgi:hypothetical protein
MDSPQDPLETLRNRLYANTPFEPARGAPLASVSPPVSAPLEPWKRTAIPEPKKRMHATTIFFLVAAAFFVIAASVAAFLFLHGTRALSSDHINIHIVPQTATIASGDSATFTVSVRNDNPLAVTNTNLYVDFPPGTLQVGTTSLPLAPYSDTLGDLQPKATASRTVSGVFFGGQNQVITIPIRFQYRTVGSNALFTATSTYQLTISTSPVSLQVNALRESASGQPLTVSVSVHSNAAVPLQNIGVMATYPNFGFAFQSAKPTPTIGSFFTIGSLAPGETKTIMVTGVLSGQEGSEGTFSFNVGTAKGDGTALLASTYTSSAATVKISHPFIGTTLSLNNQDGDTVIATPGTPINATLTWVNNLNESIANAVATVTFTGAAFDPKSVTVQGGFFRSSDNSILFSKENNPALANLAPGDSGIGTFTFSPKSAAAITGVQNPAIIATVSVSGVRAGQGDVPQSITSSVVRTIKIGTGISLSRSILHASGSLKNTGPVPPVAGTETTYTVLLGAQNTLNSVGAAKATMLLPSYVRFISAATVGNASGTANGTTTAAPVTYDASLRTVTWNIGDLSPGSAPTASFQIGFLPSTSQTNGSPVLLNEESFTGTDRFTQLPVTATVPATTLSQQSDPGFTASAGTVHS